MARIKRRAAEISWCIFIFAVVLALVIVGMSRVNSDPTVRPKKLHIVPRMNKEAGFRRDIYCAFHKCYALVENK